MGFIQSKLTTIKKICTCIGTLERKLEVPVNENNVKYTNSGSSERNYISKTSQEKINQYTFYKNIRL